MRRFIHAEIRFNRPSVNIPLPFVHIERRTLSRAPWMLQKVASSEQSQQGEGDGMRVDCSSLRSSCVITCVWPMTIASFSARRPPYKFYVSTSTWALVRNPEIAASSYEELATKLARNIARKTKILRETEKHPEMSPRMRHETSY